MYQWHDGGWGPGAWIGMAVMMVVFWGLIAALVVYVVRSTGSRGTDRHAGEADGAAAIRILDERFARGDIDAEEYTRRRDLLRGR